MTNILVEMVHNCGFEHANASFMRMSFIMCAQQGWRGVGAQQGWRGVGAQQGWRGVGVKCCCF